MGPWSAQGQGGDFSFLPRLGRGRRVGCSHHCLWSGWLSSSLSSSSEGRRKGEVAMVGVFGRRLGGGKGTGSRLKRWEDEMRRQRRFAYLLRAEREGRR